MSLRNDDKNMWARMALRLVLLIGAITAVVYWIPFLWKILGPFLVGLAVAAVLQPAVRLMKRFGVKRWVSALVLLLLFYTVLGLLTYWFLSFVVTQAINALQNAPQWIDGINELYSRFRAHLSTMLEDSANVRRLDDVMSKAYQQLTNWATATAGTLVGQTVNFAVSVPNILIFANFLILSSFFLTKDFPFGKKKKQGDGRLSQIMQMQRSAAEAITGYLRVQVIYTIFVLAVSAIGFTVFGVPYGFLLSCLAGLLEFLPLFGNGTLYVPMIIICFLLGEYRIGFVTLGVHLILYITRKVTEPRVMNRQMGLNPVLSLLSMYIGLQTFGVVGLTLAPILMVVLQTAWRSGMFNGLIRDVKGCARWIVLFLNPDNGQEADPKNIPAPEKEPEPPAAPPKKQQNIERRDRENAGHGHESTAGAGGHTDGA